MAKLAVQRPRRTSTCMHQVLLQLAAVLPPPAEAAVPTTGLRSVPHRRLLLLEGCRLAGWRQALPPGTVAAGATCHLAHLPPRPRGSFFSFSSEAGLFCQFNCAGGLFRQKVRQAGPTDTLKLTFTRCASRTLIPNAYDLFVQDQRCLHYIPKVSCES